MLASRAVARSPGMRPPAAPLACASARRRPRTPAPRLRKRRRPAGALPRCGLRPRSPASRSGTPGRALLVHGDESSERALELLEARHVRERLGQSRNHLPAPVRHGRLHELCPAAEVVVELALARPGGSENLLQARSLHTVLGDELRHPFDDPLATRSPPSRHRLARHPPTLALFGLHGPIIDFDPPDGEVPTAVGTASSTDGERASTFRGS